MTRIVGMAGLMGAVALLVQCTAPPVPEAPEEKPYITTEQPLTIMSVNDGDSHLRLNREEKLDRENHTEDSITSVHLGPDHPPIVKTVYGIAPNTISGAPYMAMSSDGRYGFVTGRDTGTSAGEPDQLTVIDLASPDLEVVQEIPVERATMVSAHPDGRHIIVPYRGGFQVYELRDGRLALVKDNTLDVRPGSIDISSKGDRIIATGPAAAGGSTMHTFSYANDGTIAHIGEVAIREGLPPFNGPFSARISPDGSRALVPNGFGSGSKGTLDDVHIIDMTLNPPQVTEVIPQVADGMESVAFHPQGHMAVIACLEEFRIRAHITYSHLAVVDMTNSPPRILSYQNIEAIPEGIEFSPAGDKLFVGVTSGNHISVFDVEGLIIKRHPYVIRVGHGPSSMAIGPRYQR